MEYTTEVINISKIEEGLFIGDQIAGTTLEVIVQFKISHIINAAGREIINQFERLGKKYLTLNWAEDPTQNLFDTKDLIATKIVEFIDESFKKGEGLLAHSVKGQNRVCVVIVIYLIKKFEWTLGKCLDFLASKKQDVDIPNYFLEQLSMFEKRLGINPLTIPKSFNWKKEDIKDTEEMLMRNTYINGLAIEDIQNNYNENGIKINNDINLNKKKKKSVAWIDNNPYGRSNILTSVNPQNDLVMQKDIKNITSHMRLKPNKSCIKFRSNSVNCNSLRKDDVGNINNNMSIERNLLLNNNSINNNNFINVNHSKIFENKCNRVSRSVNVENRKDNINNNINNINNINKNNINININNNSNNEDVIDKNINNKLLMNNNNVSNNLKFNNNNCINVNINHNLNLNNMNSSNHNSNIAIINKDLENIGINKSSQDNNNINVNFQKLKNNISDQFGGVKMDINSEPMIKNNNNSSNNNNDINNNNNNQNIKSKMNSNNNNNYLNINPTSINSLSNLNSQPQQKQLKQYISNPILNQFNKNKQINNNNYNSNNNNTPIMLSSNQNLISPTSLSNNMNNNNGNMNNRMNHFMEDSSNLNNNNNPNINKKNLSNNIQNNNMNNIQNNNNINMMNNSNVLNNNNNNNNNKMLKQQQRSNTFDKNNMNNGNINNNRKKNININNNNSNNFNYNNPYPLNLGNYMNIQNQNMSNNNSNNNNNNNSNNQNNNNFLNNYLKSQSVPKNELGNEENSKNIISLSPEQHHIKKEKNNSNNFRLKEQVNYENNNNNNNNSNFFIQNPQYIGAKATKNSSLNSKKNHNLMKNNTEMRLGNSSSEKHFNNASLQFENKMGINNANISIKKQIDNYLKNDSRSNFNSIYGQKDRFLNNNNSNSFATIMKNNSTNNINFANNRNQFLGGYNTNNNQKINNNNINGISQLLNNYNNKNSSNKSLQNNNNNSNYQQNYLNLNNFNANNMRPPLNNFDPSLIKNNNLQNNNSQNLFNKSNNPSKNPVTKTQKEYIPNNRKVSTPDQFSMHPFNGLNINNNSKETKIITTSASSSNYSLGAYQNMHGSVSTKNKNFSINHNNKPSNNNIINNNKPKLNAEFNIVNRPSTAPHHHDKKTQNILSNSNNNLVNVNRKVFNNNDNSNFNRHFNNNYLYGTLKRAPTPMGHNHSTNNVNTLYASQKLSHKNFNRPMTHNTNTNFNIDYIGSIKQNKKSSANSNKMNAKF